MLHKKYIFILLLMLAACGFEPLYVERQQDDTWYFGGNFDTSISQEMAKVKIQPISDRFGQILRNDLIDLISPKGQPEEPKYRLYVRLAKKSETNQALRSDITATRKMVRYKVAYYMMEGTEKVLEGDSLAFTSYDILANPYSTTIAKKKGDEEAARIVANDISLRLGAYFHKIITNRGELDDFKAVTDR